MYSAKVWLPLGLGSLLALGGVVAAGSQEISQAVPQAVPQQEASPQRLATAPGVANGWIELTYLQGGVTVFLPETRTAKLGDRLIRPGQGLATQPRSAATLLLDRQIGRLQVAENTRFEIRRLDMIQGGRVTHLDLLRGQIRIQARKFSNPYSQLTVTTPSGIAAVRGTEFGVSVNPSDRMAVGTNEGSVEISAQGQAVQVDPGFASLVYPGEPPLPPIPLDRQLNLNLTQISRRGDRVRLSGQIDPANSLIQGGDQVLPSDRQGRFTLVLSNPNETLELIVRNPLGDQKRYRLSGF